MTLEHNLTKINNLYLYSLIYILAYKYTKKQSIIRKCFNVVEEKDHAR